MGVSQAIAHHGAMSNHYTLTKALPKTISSTLMAVATTMLSSSTWSSSLFSNPNRQLYASSVCFHSSICFFCKPSAPIVQTNKSSLEHMITVKITIWFLVAAHPNSTCLTNVLSRPSGIMLSTLCPANVTFLQPGSQLIMYI